jgi:arylsulfatase A-like enzyme
MRRTIRRSMLAGACALAALGACSREPRPPLNVVLVSIDTLRADRMSLYGGPRPTTPHIDALAKRGVHFTHAYSPSPWTLPAHASMLTGKYPSALSSNFDAPLYRMAPLLSTMLKARGYRTAAVTGGGFVSGAFGADVGFDSFKTTNVDDAVGWIRTRPGDPFFLFFHTYATHTPYHDRRYLEGLDPGRLAHIYEKGVFWIGLHLQLTCGEFDYTPAEREYARAFYDGGVAVADEMVGRIVAELEHAGVLDRTIVIVTSDHGEEFWDHTGRGAYHGHTLYDELLRVPLVWYEPDLSGAGKARDEPVDLVDIVPTVLARIGAPMPVGLDGVDLSPLLDGERWTKERALFAEAVRHGPARRSIRTAAGKLIVTPEPSVQLGEGQKCAVPVLAPEELYLPDDTGETRNRIAEDAALAATLASPLAAHASRTPAVAGATPATVDQETRERLKQLGYAH